MCVARASVLFARGSPPPLCIVASAGCDEQEVHSTVWRLTRGLFRLRSGFVGVALALLVQCLGCDGSGETASDFDPGGAVAEWPHWGGDAGARHFSPLTQITSENVESLEVAWTHRSGDAADGSGSSKATAFQATPLVVNDHLYYCTPFMRVFALDPETGEERWRFDPELRARHGEGPYPLTCRGVSYWQDPEAEAGSVCQKRIFYGTADSELIALDADRGTPCPDFGRAGRVALREGIGQAPPWEYLPTSPPLVIRDRVVIGALVADNLRVDAPSGVVRAFDARTGKLDWAWDPVPPGHEVVPDPTTGRRYAAGTPNIWSIITADPERGLVFVPTGNPSPDLFGGLRDGLDHYGSSTVALEAETGKVAWHFRFVHNDVWDYDTPSPPTLFQIPGVGVGMGAGEGDFEDGGEGVPALLQTTKMGFVFLLDRRTGRPLYGAQERPAPGGAVREERLSRTQPYPSHVEPLHPLTLDPEDAFGFTPFDRARCRERIESLRNDGIFTPPSVEGSLQYPHTAGGMNWGGVALDEERGLMIVNQNHAANVIRLIPRALADDLQPEDFVYPSEFYPMHGTPYAAERSLLTSPFGAPCNPPPWGSLTAVDLRTGKIRWTRPLGTLRGTAPFPIWWLFDDTGSPSFGGGLSTASGLYFIGATMDRYLRAFDVETGEELWRDRLPFVGNAVPMTYRLGAGRRQFVVMAAGGNPLTGMGDVLVAYALPEPGRR